MFFSFFLAKLYSTNEKYIRTIQADSGFELLPLNSRLIHLFIGPSFMAQDRPKKVRAGLQAGPAHERPSLLENDSVIYLAVGYHQSHSQQQG